MGRETLVDWSTCPAAAAWVCSILQLQASRGQGVPGCSGAADSKSMDSRCPRPAAAANLLPGVLQLAAGAGTPLHTGDPFKVQNRPAAAAAEPSVGFA